MKKFLRRFTALSFMSIAASSVFAASPSAELKVKGIIIPAACVVSLDGDGEVNYGVIDGSALRRDAFNLLTKKSVQLNVRCSAPVKLGMSIVDNRNGSAPINLGQGVQVLDQANLMDDKFFGLGGNSVGGYAMRLNNVTVDGKSTSLMASQDRDAWSVTGGASVLLDQINTVSWGESAHTAPTSGTHITGSVDVQAVLNKASALDLTNSIHLDGSATLTIHYL